LDLIRLVHYGTGRMEGAFPIEKRDPCVFDIGSSGIRDSNILAISYEELLADAALQVLDILRDRGLGNVDLFGRKAVVHSSDSATADSRNLVGLRAIVELPILFSECGRWDQQLGGAGMTPTQTKVIPSEMLFNWTRPIVKTN
jgi:hypothetical protein